MLRDASAQGDRAREITLLCPQCDAELSVADHLNTCHCHACGQVIDIPAHLAFEWAQEVFLDARQIAIQRRIFPIGKRTRWHAFDEDVALPYEQAYSALREAFRARLHENQRKAGIEIMSEITGLLAQHLMTSPIEAKYWLALLIEQTGLDEVQEYRARLTWATGPFAWMNVAWCRLRLWRLHTRLTKIDRQVNQWEQLIDFVDPVRARLPKAQRQY